jgi:predicted ester cyclase
MPATGHPVRMGGDAAATQQTRATVADFLNALASGDRYDDHLAERVTHTVMETGEVTTGRNAVVRLTDHLYREAFAASLNLRGLVVEGQRACLEADFVGTHVGEFAGILPTRRIVGVPVAVACDVADGKIAALRVYVSLDALVRQVRDA